MISFQTIKWKNFLSTGNQFTEINFQKSDTTLIIGTNGAGKSTVLDALCYVLFNKPFRKIYKSQLINTINEKDCMVEVEFSIGSRQYLVRRGMKPSVFEIHQNGKCLDQLANAVDQQKYLEQNILKLNFKSFTQIVILGSSSFVPFMQLSAPGRREVIEDILDIKIFSSMNEVVKTKLRGIRDNVKVLDLKKENLTDKISMQKNFIKELEEQGQERIKKKKNTLNELVVENEELLESNEVKNKELLTISNKMTDVSNATTNLKKLGTLKGRVSNKVSTATTDLKFFKENTVCPTCTQHIEEEFRLNKVVDAQTKLDELSSGLDDLLETIKTEENRERQFNELSKEVTRLTHEISNNNIRISGIHKQSKNLGNEIQTITSNLQNKNSEHEKLETFKQDLESSYNKITEQKTKERDYDFVYSLLKDGGVKTKIIKKYLPLINQQINRYLQMMDFYINFTLDEEFNESVKSPIHEDFSYASFSEGEKMRIDLALLFTWREVARFKNSTNTNLLIMDEVFDSSLDTFGTDEFMKIIRYVLKGANIFIISHKTELLDKFSATIKFEKHKGFSKLL